VITLTFRNDYSSRLRPLGRTRTKYYLVHLPGAGRRTGLDHFEGRSLPGWQRHVVLNALAYGFLQGERRQRRRR
jgi:hypothetical protein